MRDGWNAFFQQGSDDFPWNSAHVYRQRTTVELIRAVYETRRGRGIWG